MNNPTVTNRRTLLLFFLLTVLSIGDSAYSSLIANQKMTLVRPAKWALIIAVDAPGSSAGNSVGIAREIAAVLRSRYGYDAEHLIELYDENADSRTINTTFFRLIDEINSHDTFYAYFALPVSPYFKEPVLVTSGSDRGGIPFSQIEKVFSSIRARSSFAVFAGCFELTTRWFSTDIRQVIARGPGRIPFPMLSLCANREFEKNPGSTFLAAIRGEAADASGCIKISNLVSYLRRQQPQASFPLYMPYVDPSMEFRFAAEISELNPDLIQQITDPANGSQNRLRAIDELLTSWQRMPEDSKRASVAQLREILQPLARDVKADESLRSRSIQALGQLRDGASMDIITRLLQTSNSVKIKESCIRALAAVPDRDALEVIRNTLGDENPDIRILVIRTLLSLGDANSYPHILEIIRSDQNAAVRLTALELFPFAQLENAQKEEILFQLLRDPAPDIRNEVINTFSLINYQIAIPPMIEQFKRERDERIRQNIAFKLGQLFKEEYRAIVEEILLRALQKDVSRSVRAAAAIALGQIGAKTAEDQLIKGLDDDSRDIRRSAAESLGNLQSGKAAKKLIQLLSDQDAEVRRAAVIALGQIGDAKAIDPLISRLNDDNMYVRAAAGEALEKIKSAPKKNVLVEALNSSSPNMRIEAIRKLAELQNTEAIPHLIRRLADDEYAVRQAAIAGLSQFRDERSFGLISTGLQDDNFLVRLGTAIVLGALATPSALVSLLQHGQDPSSVVRSQIATILGAWDDDRAVDAVVACLNDVDASVANAAAAALVMQVFRLEKQDRRDRLDAIAVTIQDRLANSKKVDRQWDSWFKMFYLNSPSPFLKLAVSASKPSPASAQEPGERMPHLFKEAEVVRVRIENSSDVDYYYVVMDLGDDGSITGLSYFDHTEKVLAHSAAENMAILDLPSGRERASDMIKVFAAPHPIYFPEHFSLDSVLSLLPALQPLYSAGQLIDVTKN